MLTARLVSCAALITLLVGCGGGQKTLPPAPAQNQGQTTGAIPTPSAAATAKFTLTLGGTRRAATLRHEQFISGGINAITIWTGLVQGYPGDAIATTFDVSVATGTGTGKTCSANNDGSRTCTLYIPAPVGNTQFYFQTYNVVTPGTPPTIPTDGSARVLSVASATQTIVAGGSNTVSVTLLGNIGAAYFTQGVSIPNAGQGLSFPGNASYVSQISVYATDGANRTIFGSFGAPSTQQLIAGPETLQIENLSGQHTWLVPYASGSFSTVCSNQSRISSDQTTWPTFSAAPFANYAICYDGQGSPGYYGEFILGLSSVSGSAVGILYVTPLFVVPSKTSLVGPGDTATLTANEAGIYPNAPTFTATTSAGCTGISVTPSSGVATQNSLFGNVANYAFPFTITQTAATGSCSVAISDGTASVTTSFVGGATGFTITIGP